MAAKREITKRKNMEKRDPITYHVEVNVDVNGNFKYSAYNTPDASSIRPHNGDKISWSVRLMGIPVPFQVEFPDFSPFDKGVRAVRSMFQPSDPLTVFVPPFYHGNLVFKYTVTIANAWSDDPDVEPVPSDGVAGTQDSQVLLLSIEGGNLVLNNPNASFSRGEVAWKWAGQPLDDFSLTFEATVPPGWPPHTNSQSRRIALDLETAGSQYYNIQTLNLGLSVRGKLTLP